MQAHSLQVWLPGLPGTTVLSSVVTRPRSPLLSPSDGQPAAFCLVRSVIEAVDVEHHASRHAVQDATPPFSLSGSYIMMVDRGPGECKTASTMSSSVRGIAYRLRLTCIRLLRRGAGHAAVQVRAEGLERAAGRSHWGELSTTCAAARSIHSRFCSTRQSSVLSARHGDITMSIVFVFQRGDSLFYLPEGLY